jgi:hypothetical protein
MRFNLTLAQLLRMIFTDVGLSLVFLTKNYVRIESARKQYSSPLGTLQQKAK